MMIVSCGAETPTTKNLLGVKGYKIAVDFDEYKKVSCLSWEVMKRSNTYIYFRVRLRGLDPGTSWMDALAAKIKDFSRHAPSCRRQGERNGNGYEWSSSDVGRK